ncbi:MAG: hypothetical protein GDA67_11805 [Nitrospira sp. CR1.3]|nr:hypothetical protein [Nitrospira sp. CR1.3]
MITVSGALVCVGLLIRLLPNWLAKGVLGVDHWYWKTYIESYRANKRFPPQLPQYLLDQHQWYPPVFPLIVAVLPDSFFDRFNHLIAIAIDLCRMVFVLAASFWITEGNAMAMVVAGLLYATSPMLVSYNTQLNPRGLGALLLDSALCLSLWAESAGGSLAIGGIIALLAGGILLTHKMTTQLFWFLCLSMGLILGDWRFLLLIPLSIGVAILLSRGFYLDVLKAHWDIVTFWNRNWRWLQAHPVKESPIYGEPGFETPTRFYRRGLPGIMRHLQYLVGFCPAAWIILAGAFVGGLQLSVASYRFVALWGALCLAFSLLTLSVPFMKCLGSGYFYLYNAAFPAALMGALIHRSLPDWEGVIWFAVVANLLALGLYYRTVVRSKRPQPDGSFDHALEFLKAAPKGTVMCLPLQWSDVVAYKTEQAVLTGGHGYGFKLFEPLFPRLMMPIQEVIRKFDVRYLITMEGYLTDRFHQELSPAKDNQFGPYHVYITKA